MTELILDNTYLILLLPFWIFLIIMGGRFFSVYVNKKIIYILTLFSSLLGTLLCSFNLATLRNPIEQTFQFIKINNFIIPLGIQVDKLSLIIAITLFIVSFFVQLFSISYMENENKNYRFFAFLNMFNFAMAGLIFSPNLFQMYGFWELVGVMSYLLIGFEYRKKEKSEASKRVFIINRIGDTAFLSGIILTSYFMYNYAGNLSFSSLALGDMNAISTLLCAYTSTPQFFIICLLFLISAFVKSAQFPFYTWLQDAMEAKLPVSALLHSATMVIAGVYLTIRLLPFFTLNNNLMIFISTIGITTAIICSILASIETHPKKVLAYSTSANLGLMFLAIGIENIKAGIILLVVHAFIKAMLFLLLPQDKKEIGWIPYITFLIGALTISGLIFSGLVAKELIFASLNNIWSILFCITSFLGSFYIIRLSAIILQDRKLVKSTKWSEYFPSIGLFILSLILYIYLKNLGGYKIAEPFYSALVGWIIVYLLYTKNLLTKLSQTPKLLEKLYYNCIPHVYERFCNFCNAIDTKVFANYKILITTAKTSVQIFNWIENNIMHKSVKFITLWCKQISKTDLRLQNGNVQTYNAYGFIIITAIICLVIIGYTLIFSQIG